MLFREKKSRKPQLSTPDSQANKQNAQPTAPRQYLAPLLFTDLGSLDSASEVYHRLV